MEKNLVVKASLANQLEQIIIERIREGYYARGEKLPSEGEIAEEFGVSKATIRVAFNALAAKGLVVRRQGVGTFVRQGAKLNNPLDQSYDFLELIASNGQTAGFVELKSQVIEPNEGVRGKLDLDPGQLVYEVHKLFTADGEPVIYSHNFIFPLTQSNTCRGSG